MDWREIREATWWADLVTIPKKPRKNDPFRQLDTRALTRGIMLQKIVQTAAVVSPSEIRIRADGEWIVKTRGEWALACRFNRPTVGLRIAELKKLGFVEVGRQRDLNGSGNLALSIKVLWSAIEKRVQEMTKAA